MGYPAEEMEKLAGRAGPELEEASAADVVRWAADTFGDRVCVTASMADAVVVHLASQARPGVDVVFLDTGYHFAETLGTRDAVAAAYAVNVVNVTPEQTIAEQDAQYGPRLYERNPDQCCHLRKVLPLQRALTRYDAWMTGLRRDESPARSNTPVVGWDERRRKVKIAPLARWTEADVEAYVAEHGILVNPLLAEGFPSIGCAPCTRRPSPGEDPRAGRWAGFLKTECGIHT